VPFVRGEREREGEGDRNSVRVVMAATIAETVAEERESEAEKQRSKERTVSLLDQIISTTFLLRMKPNRSLKSLLYSCYCFKRSRSSFRLLTFHFL
jgi:protein subunit release factor B